jgi:hypothetical protein
MDCLLIGGRKRRARALNRRRLRNSARTFIGAIWNDSLALSITVG